MAMHGATRQILCRFQGNGIIRCRTHGGDCSTLTYIQKYSIFCPELFVFFSVCFKTDRF